MEDGDDECVLCMESFLADEQVGNHSSPPSVQMCGPCVTQPAVQRPNPCQPHLFVPFHRRSKCSAAHTTFMHSASTGGFLWATSRATAEVVRSVQEARSDALSELCIPSTLNSTDSFTYMACALHAWGEGCPAVARAHTVLRTGWEGVHHAASVP